MDSHILFGEYLNLLVYLTKCAITGEKPDKISPTVDLKQLYLLAAMHSIENIIYVSLSKLENIDEKELAAFKTSAAKSAIIEANQQYYLDKISDAFEKNKIKFCIMKGPVIRKLYPSPDMRKSGDIDIFVDDKNTENVRDILTEIGFQTKSFNRSHAHDEYCIGEFVVVEVHRQLISNKCPWDKECQKIADRLVLQKEKEYTYIMTHEDYYLYMIGHMAKHMKYSGMGIKMVLDVWVYLKALGSKLDMETLEKNLIACGLKEFESNVRKLCNHWFEGDVADETVKKLAYYVGMSGNFGTHEQLVGTEMAQNSVGTTNKRISKFIYYVRLIFFPYKHMKEKYPVLKKYPILLPVFWVYRPLHALLFDKEKSQTVKSKYDNIDMEFGKKIVDFKKEIGL